MNFFRQFPSLLRAGNNLQLSIKHARYFTTKASSMAVTDSKMPPMYTMASPPTSILTGKPYDYEGTLKKKKNHGFLNLYYGDEPIMLARGNMQYVYDHTGKEYLDSFGGILSVGIGHCHPKVQPYQMKAITSFTHASCCYMTGEMYEYLDELLATFPPGYSAYLVNSGSEANELAITIAREYTGNFEVFSFRGAYHGMTNTVMGALGNQTQKYKAPTASGFHKVLNPNPYRSLAPPEKATEFYANDLKEALWANTSGNCALFMAESIQGVNGITGYPEGYMKAAYDVVRAAGGLTLADEVQSGFGRTGETFWRWESFGVQPDIVIMAKTMGNGIPIAALVCRSEIMEAIGHKTFINTFGGNLVTVASAYATLQTIKEENMQENCKTLGNYMMAHFKEMQHKYENLGEARGAGFMMGIEFVKDKESKAPCTESAEKVLSYCKNHGVLIGKCGYGSVLRITPPYCFTKDNADQVLQTFEDGVKTL